ncbi:MAG: SUMF1/EgtB/PvdO family nonheme iron enzyme [Candidatus Contendobacter sp.]|jgi:formylglycine-generating enzyme required for sulfatase activity/serine/threonine protein kinase|nr:SUMF1/EgtB/PvdO family nonheme iron enzyme [Gammaproteobacteria bacterium]MCC8992607.1 SUMF1/EgtB/PvdO family nonheme iron enzyme [Candidatus Contendobacter sp.]
MTEESNALPTGYSLHRYQIESILGAGGFGITYRAMHEALENEVAIKEYFPAEWAYRDHQGISVRPNTQGQIPARQGEPPCYEWGLQRFLDEAKILVQINHPGVVRVRDYFTANGSAYIVMEYEEGESLSGMLQRGGILPEPELRHLLDDIMPALEAVHGQGYLHRDLKPSNLYVRSQDNHVILIDFGAARQALGRRTRSVTSVVTPGYSPIEQYVTVGDDYGPWTDIYALGAVLYRCITGAPPVEAPGRVLKDPVQPAIEVGAGLYSHGLLQVVDQSLAVRPEDRFQSVAAMRQALQAADRSSEYGDFSQVPPISPELLDLSSADSLRYEPPSARAGSIGNERRPLASPVQGRLAPLSFAPRQAESASPRQVQSTPLQQQAPIADAALQAKPLQTASADLSLPLLENIWEHLDEPPPPPPPPNPLIARTPVTGEAPSQLSKPLLKRSPQSAVEHLRKSSISRRGASTSQPSERVDPSSRRASGALGKTDADGQPANGQKIPDAPSPIESVEAVRAVHWTQVLLITFVLAGLLGVGLLGYQYYQSYQEQSQRKAEALQRRQAEEAKRRAQEDAARKQEVAIALSLEQTRKAMADKQWDQARRYLEQATAINATHPAVVTARTDLQTAQQPTVDRTRTENTTGLELIWIEGGCFTMGSPPGERDRSSDEAPHQVCVKGFWIGKTELTNGQYRRFKSAHDSGNFQGRSLNGDTQPAVNLNWSDAQAFAEWLSWEAGGGKRFRLPSEAEWEYAARAGAITRYPWGNDLDPRYANFSDRNDPTGASIGSLDDGQAVTAPVGNYLPNAFGLHDVIGNVWEWTCSEYQPAYGGEEQVCSVKRPSEGQRGVRGGSWNNGPGELRSARRLARKPGDRDAMTGFRILQEE